MSVKKASIIMLFILHGAILVSFARASPVSLASRQVGLSTDVQVLTVNGSQDCEYEGEIYHNGDSFKDPSNPCSTCQCSGGDVSCSVKTCPPSPSEECEKVKEEGKCCPSYICPISSDELDNQTKTESVLADTTTLPTLREEDDKKEHPIDQAQNAVNSLFIHKVILETIKKEKEQAESTVATLTELPISSQEDSEPIQTSTLSENYEADEFISPTTLEAISELEATSELSVDENLVREASDESTIRSETDTFNPTERSVQEENDMDQSLVTEDSSLREEIGADNNASEQRETTETSSTDKNSENEENNSATVKQVSELNEEFTPSLIDALYSDKIEELFTTEPAAGATEASETKIEESETSVPEIENLIKAAESVIASQTESYLEENSIPERSNAMETTPYYEERDVSTSGYRQVSELSEQTTELLQLEPRLADNDENFDHVSTISNTEILDESDGDSSPLLGTETPFDIRTIRSVDYVSPTELSDEIPVTTSNYENNNPKDEDSDLRYVFEEEKIVQASKSQKSESINIEEINRNDDQIAEGTTKEVETSTQSNIDTRSSSNNEETTTALDLVDGEAVTVGGEEAEVENLLRFDISENSVSDFERSSDVTSGYYTTETYSTTVLSEDTETKTVDTESDLGVNSARKESVDETTTSEIDSEDEFILAEESTTQSGTLRLLDEAFISTTEISESIEDNWETTKVPDVRQEAEFLTTTFPEKIESEAVESGTESVVETKSENASGQSNETATETEVKIQEKTSEKSESVENNWESTEIPVERQESEILATTISNIKENENVESRIESVVEEKLENTSEKGNEKVIENEEKSQVQTTEKSETEESNWDSTEIPQVQESKFFTNILSNKEEREDVQNKVDSVAETKLEHASEESDEPTTEVKSQEKTLGESNQKVKRKPQDSNIHVFEKILSNGSVTRIETHSSEDRKRPKMDRISTQFHHLARKYGLRPLTRKTLKDDVKNRRRYRMGSRKSMFEDKQ